MNEPTAPIFRVLPRQVNQTVSAALREWMPGQSWSQIRRLLKSRRVMVSGNICVDEARRLQLVDVVKILPSAAAPAPTPDAVRICYLDSHVVVVEKPAGLTTTRHAEERDWPARRRQLQPTLDEMLPRLIENESGRKHGQKSEGRPKPVRPVHRLDRETSGLMVFARTVLAERILGQQFRKHTTGRRYLAIVEGDVEAQTIESQLVRDRGDGRRGSTNLPNLGKTAITHVRPIEKLNGYTFIECRLETGRTHQIRIHLSELGHPLCGEKVYRQPHRGQAPLPDNSGAPRVALHATELSFQHPVSGEELHFEMPLPPDLQRLLQKLRGPAAGPPRPKKRNRRSEDQ
jgi:23S rRNA pseudouridine1911/1915/1917 synthase